MIQARAGQIQRTSARLSQGGGLGMAKQTSGRRFLKAQPTLSDVPPEKCPAVMRTDAAPGRHYGVIGLRLAHLVAFPEPSLARRIPNRSEGILEDEVNVVRALWHLALEGAFSVRYLMTPGAPERLLVALLGRVEGASPREAAEQAQELMEGLKAALQVHLEHLHFQPLSPSEVEQALCPFPIDDVVEIARQEALLNIASFEMAFPGQPARLIGFGSGADLAPGPKDQGLDRFHQPLYYLFPFVPPTKALTRWEGTRRMILENEESLRPLVHLVDEAWKAPEAETP